MKVWERTQVVREGTEVEERTEIGQRRNGSRRKQRGKEEK
jgi:hypothetical protein